MIFEPSAPFDNRISELSPFQQWGETGYRRGESDKASDTDRGVFVEQTRGRRGRRMTRRYERGTAGL